MITFIKWLKNSRIVHLFFIFVFIYILILVVPAGTYERVYDGGLGRAVIVPDTYKVLDKKLLNLLDLGACLYSGYIKASGIMLFLFSFSWYLSTMLETNLLQSLLLVKKLKKIVLH